MAGASGGWTEPMAVRLEACKHALVPRLQHEPANRRGGLCDGLVQAQGEHQLRGAENPARWHGASSIVVVSDEPLLPLPLRGVGELSSIASKNQKR